MKLAIIIPAFNESQVLLKVLKSLPKEIENVSKIETFVVDDGSTDDTYHQALKANVKVIKHHLNRGVGAATKTGIELAKRKRIDVVVTFDADGQHYPKDIEKIIKPIISKEADLVIGSRFKKSQKIPLDRLYLNRLANVATLFLFGVFSTDSQSGLRAFSKKAFNLINFKSDRMEFSSEVLLEARRNNLKIVEVPTRAIYTDYSRTKGQKNSNAIPIFARYLVKLLR